MARGGRRAGRPDVDYPNRADLAMAPRTAPVARIPGQTYGMQKQQVDTQQAATRAAQVRAESAPEPAIPPMAPLAPVQFATPTERPYEPVTAGLRAGPGPGPEAFGLDDGDALIAALAGAAERFPQYGPDIIRLLLDEQARRAR